MPNTALGFGFDEAGSLTTARVDGKGGGPSSLSLSLSRYPHPLPPFARDSLRGDGEIGLGDGGCERRGSGREVATKATAKERAVRVAPAYCAPGPLRTEEESEPARRGRRAPLLQTAARISLPRWPWAARTGAEGARTSGTGGAAPVVVSRLERETRR
jgi:hypothetical protein